MEKRRQADERHQRLEAEKQEALAVKRQLMAARSERQHNTLKGIRQGEEEFKLSIKHKQHQADQHLQEQRDQIAQLHERKKILASARENERLHCVQRTRRAQEHILQRQVQRHMEMERRASGLQDERRALIAERAKSAKTLALQRAAVQEQFKKARSVGDLKKSKSMLAEIGIDLDTLTAISETMLSSTSIAGAKAPGEGSSLSVGGRPSTAPESPPGERGGKKRGSQSAPKPSRAEAAGGSLAEPPMA
eukprot:Transcript_30440.p2 GENE.Transcript_30440~~Transcript_30440.p2  ORF type:complete len:249 (-),score=118.29 Transcript_30440:253-999(-)